MTVLAKGWKSSATQKENFSIESNDFQTGIKTSTRLQLAKPAPKDTSMIAILADPQTVNELPLEEIQDQALVERIGRYIKSTNALNLDPDADTEDALAQVVINHLVV